MTYPTRIDVCDGKYTVIYDPETGQSECLRYGEKWRDLCGDKMVQAMFDRIVELETELAALKSQEPFCYMLHKEGGDSLSSIRTVKMPRNGYAIADAMPLYAAPLPAVPEVMK